MTAFDSRLILLISAEPSDQERLRVAAEFRDIDYEFRSSLRRGDYRVRQIGAARASDVARAILEEEAYIVHFAGHGDEGLLCLEDDDGETRTLDAETFAKIFSVRRPPPACVVLNACYSDSHADALLQHVPMVIAMAANVNDDVAAAFAAGFYAGLGAGLPIEDAFEWGRVRLDLRGFERWLPTLRRSTIVCQNEPTVAAKVGLRIDSIAADSKLCPYDTFTFDPAKPPWPENDGGAVVYQRGSVEVYGKKFPSWTEANEYGELLARTHNHRVFGPNAVQRIHLEEVKRKTTINVPVLYVAVSNVSEDQLVMTELRAHVACASPLAAAGTSAVLNPVVSYELSVYPSLGVYTEQLVPALKVAANDATAFRVILRPRVARIGGYFWLMRLKLVTSQGDETDSEYISLIM